MAHGRARAHVCSFPQVAAPEVFQTCQRGPVAVRPDEVRKFHRPDNEADLVRFEKMQEVESDLRCGWVSVLPVVTVVFPDIPLGRNDSVPLFLELAEVSLKIARGEHIDA